MLRNLRFAALALVMGANVWAATVTMDKTAATAANAVAVSTDKQAGLGAWQASGVSPKAEIYLPVQTLFGRPVLVSELASISYHTKKGGDQGSVDWYMVIYTKPYAGGDGSWYGNRLNAEPMYSSDLNAPPGQWNQWSTAAGANQLRFFDQARTYMGFYGGPTLAEIAGGEINWGSYPGSGGTAVMDYSGKEVLYVSFQVGSGWVNGFTGLVDAMSITLGDGSSVLVDLESAPEVWVDAAYNSSTPGWGVTKFAAIQPAVAAVDTGGKVNVAAGTYAADNIALNKALSIQGAGSSTILIPGAGGIMFPLTAGGVAFKDLAVQLPPLTKRFVQMGGPSINGFTVERITVQGGDRAIEIQANSVSNLVISDSHFADVKYTVRSASFVVVDGLTVTGCTFEGGPNTDAANNTIAIYQASDGGAGQMRNVTITDNVFRNLNADSWPGVGFYVEELADAVIADNVFDACFRAFYIYKAYNLGRPVSNVAVTNNEFRNCGNAGIELRNYTGFDTITIQENSFVGNARGIRAHGDGAGWDSLAIKQNSFVGNAIEGVGVLTGYDPAGQELGGARLLAKNNWWGSASGPGPVGPGTGDRVNALVDYDPWLGKPADADVVYLQPTDASIYVKPTETVVVDLNVANLSQPVTALQAMLGFSSTYFQAGPGQVNVVAGGGVWNDLIWNVWNTAGDLDVAVGIHYDNFSAGTQEDAKTAIITLTPNGTEGVTKLVFRPDADPDPGLVASTFLAGTAGNAVWPAKLDSATIYIDGSAPENVMITADPVSWTNSNNVVLTFSAGDALAGIDRYELQLDGEAFFTAASPYSLDVSAVTDGAHTVTVKAIDRAGNEATASTTIYLDKTDPTVNVASAKQGGVELLGVSLNAIQGVVNIQVTAADATSPLAAPVVTVTPNGGTAEAAGFVDESPAGTFNYAWSVTSTTANGVATITATATDAAGNDAADTDTFNINKNQVTGQVELQGFLGSSRVVTFVATGGTVKTWTQTLSFVDRVASFTLTDVPAGTTGISAKTDWSLRNKLAVTPDADGQAAANFTEGEMLLGGDLNGSNSINVLDYSVMKTKWYTADPAADVNGSGRVDLTDYSIQKANWFKVGDPQ